MLNPNRVKWTQFRDKLPEKFVEKFELKSDNECWEWQSSLSWQGYGWYRPPGKRASLKAHRVMYMLVFGNFDLSLKVLHTCDNRKCVNPNHLKLGTQDDNMQDMIQKGRDRKGDRRGNKNPAHKLTEADIPTIRQRLLNGEKPTHIGRSYGLNISTICRIRDNKGWRHVP